MRGKRATFAATVVAVVGIAAVWWFVWVPNHRPGLAPDEAYGIDVSSHQGRIDWGQVAGDKIHFAYIRASEGGDFTDTTYAENWRAADRAGLRRGAYHVFSLCSAGEAQAAHFLRTAAPQAGALPPAVDLELAGNCRKRPAASTVSAEVTVFLADIERAWHVRVVVYVGDDWEGRYPVLDRSDRPRWLASFFGRPDRRWAVWQLHGFAHVNGVNGHVDLDVGRLAQLPAPAVS